MRKRSRKKFTIPKFNFLGMGVVYLLIFIPQIWWVKIGYTGSSIGSRVRGTSKAVFGFTVPIFFVIVPYAWHFEQALLALFSGFRCRFYKGDGSTETFWAIVAPVVLAIFIAIWAGYKYLVTLFFL